MQKLSTNQIRNLFLKYFESKGHYVVEPRSLVPYNDDSLLFINSGVSTIKSYFDGSETPPAKRLVNSQKSLRTNDIDNVGVTSRHHTMFEMLGNFSIGDYSKVDAIKYGFELTTGAEWFAMDLDKLYFTVHPDDNVSYETWLSLGVPANQIIKTEDNFWEIGAGPGGPNSEIHYDRGAKYDERDAQTLIGEDIENDRFIEIWNIVFSEFNCNPGVIPRNEYSELPQKNIDTGMGLERVASIMQETESNYETDNFMVIIQEVERLTNCKYADYTVAFRVIADHVRALTFAISDGVIPANEGRGYVIRRLVRRALRFAITDLGWKKEPLLNQLVDIVISTYVDYYPELETNRNFIKDSLSNEESRFLKTIDDGLAIINNLLPKGKITGAEAFKLYDTYGFPIELTIEIAESHNVYVDEAGFTECLNEQKERARSAHQSSSGMQIQTTLLQGLTVESEFVGYDYLDVNTKIVAIIQDDQLVQSAHRMMATLVLEKTPLYAESGGQTSDLGMIGTAHVLSVAKAPHGQHLHNVVLNGEIKVGQTVNAVVDKTYRKAVCQNHSATHLLHLGLEKFVGDHAKQAGSSQDAEKTRFDFTTINKLTEEQIIGIQNFVNEQINQDHLIDIQMMDKEAALATGANALFGEKYGDVVRVVKMGESIELCGGTHVTSTAEIKKFYILSESGIGSGIRRIEALTDHRVTEYATNLSQTLDLDLKNLKEKIDNKQLIKTKNIQSLLLTNQSLKDVTAFDFEGYQVKIKEIEDANDTLKQILEKEQAGNANNILEELLEQVCQRNGVQYLEATVNVSNINELRQLADKVMEHLKSAVLVLKIENAPKISVIVKVSDDLCEEHPANQIINDVLAPYNGRGGGNKNSAQGGGELNVNN
ncbi:MAG: alanine--tRNA ligase [Mycoplasmatales bacterium]